MTAITDWLVGLCYGLAPLVAYQFKPTDDRDRRDHERI